MNSSDTDQHWMLYAMQLAAKAEAAGEVPVGAVLVKDGQVLGEGWNLSICRHDPTAHAEMQAIRQAGLVLKNYRMLDCTLYVTLEPCPMCAAAIANARIARLYYGASDPKSGGVEQGARVFAHPQCHHRPEVYDGIAGRAAEDLLKAFFAGRR
mgnify:CR=1 FL=1